MDNDIIAIADLVIEAMPFPIELQAWCSSHPNFKKALKLSNPDRFIPLGMIITSHSPVKPQDEVIGFFAYDYFQEQFKQDFIVNLGGLNTEFMLYTSLPSGKSGLYGKYVHHIKDFFLKYGSDGSYASTHYISLQTIKSYNNADLTGRAERAITKGCHMKLYGRRPVSQEELQEVMQKIKNAKAVLS